MLKWFNSTTFNYLGLHSVGSSEIRPVQRHMALIGRMWLNWPNLITVGATRCI